MWHLEMQPNRQMYSFHSDITWSSVVWGPLIERASRRVVAAVGHRSCLCS